MANSQAGFSCNAHRFLRDVKMHHPPFPSQSPGIWTLSRFLPPQLTNYPPKWSHLKFDDQLPLPHDYLCVILLQNHLKCCNLFFYRLLVPPSWESSFLPCLLPSSIPLLTFFLQDSPPLCFLLLKSPITAMIPNRSSLSQSFTAFFVLH